jgi:hypothetical protein
LIYYCRVKEVKGSKADLLSKEFKVAAQIYECNQKNESIWFTRLAELLKDQMSAATLMKALRALFEWGIVRAEYGETNKGRAGRLLFIAGESKDTIKEIYEKFWKDR